MQGAWRIPYPADEGSRYDWAREVDTGGSFEGQLGKISLGNSVWGLRIRWVQGFLVGVKWFLDRGQDDHGREREEEEAEAEAKMS